MARVIKAGAGAQKPVRPATRMLAQADVKGAIKADMVQARQEAAELLRRAEEERREILVEGRRQAALAKEEAATRGASAAFAKAAEEALGAFRKRADRYDDAADDIRTLALEIAKKLLGTEPDLGQNDVERILQRGLTQLRARRKVRVQVSAGRRKELAFERPNLMKAVDHSPDLLVEDADDVRAGFARVVTEVGGALCAEESALDAVALAVNVKEQARQGRARSTGVTEVGGLSTGDASAADGRGRTTGKLDRRQIDESEELPSAVVEEDDVEDLDAGDDVDERNDDDSDDDSDDSDASRPEASAESLPEAVIEEDDEDPEGLDATRALPARVGRPRDVSGGAARGGLTRRPDVSSTSTIRPAAAVDVPRVPTGRVEARGRAATRVLAVDERDQLNEKARSSGVARVDLGADDEDDLDLFTDAKPQRRK